MRIHPLRLGLVHAYYIYKDGVFHPQTEGRCRKALELLLRGKIDTIIIVCACKLDDQFYCDIMKKWFIDHGASKSRIFVSVCGYNTVGEIEGFEAVCRFLCICKHKHCFCLKLTAISSWYHIPRIWCLWLVRGRFVKCSASFSGTFTKDFFLEPIKFVASLCRPFSSARTLKKSLRS